MRFHVLGLPHTVSNSDFVACAYTQKVVKFCKMMKDRGHYIIHYGHEDSNTLADEQVSVVTNEDFEISYGSHDWRKNFFKFSMDDHAYTVFFKNAIKEIQDRKQPNDFILPFWGAGVKPVCDAHPDLITVEPGIGYSYGHWARWKIFESYALYHAWGGLNNVSYCNQGWYEAIIPNYFDLDEFTFCKDKDDYFLYLGRVYDGKGVNVAIEAASIAGVKLVIAGQKEDDYQLPSNVEYIGYADVPTRKQLMSKARASFLPSMYIEPFGGVQIENLLSGTPTITTDWGAFAENNLHGLTGFRCKTMGDFVNAINEVETINPENCRAWGENFSLENIAPMYEKFFTDVLNVYTGNGWYEKTSPLSLNVMTKKYPNFPPLPKKVVEDKPEPCDANGSDWWQNNLDGNILTEDGTVLNLETFMTWMGSPLAEDRKAVRSMMVNNSKNDKGISVLDVGCGVCPEYLGMQTNYAGVFDYTGLDITPKIVDYNNSNGINVALGNIQDIPFDDDSFEIVHARHVLEHLNDFKVAIDEMVRVAKEYVYIPFFIEPNNTDENSIYYGAYGSSDKIYNNCYSKKLIEEHLRANKKIISFKWVKPPAGTKSVAILVIRKVFKPKIAIWSEDSWAFGRIHSAIVKHLSDSFDFTMYDWKHVERNMELWANGEWRNYDIILGNSAIVEYPAKYQYVPSMTSEMLNKMVAVLHSPLSNHEFYKEEITLKGPLYCAITREIQSTYAPNIDIAPIGVDLEDFYPTRKITSIKRIGFIGYDSPQTRDVKRPDMFLEIAEKAGVEPVFIYDKPYTLNNKIYDDIDMLIYCSTAEGVATGICEAIACKIPVIATNVGYAKELSSIMKFDTADGAANIIQSLNRDAYYLSTYIDNLYKEVSYKYDWKKLAKYWKKIFNKRVQI